MDAPAGGPGIYEKSAVVEHLDLAAEVGRWSGARTAGQIVQELAGPAS